MNILLTGGFGYLGGRLAKHLSEAGHPVVLGSRRKLPAPAWLPHAATVVTDWDSFSALEAVCAGMGAVVHLAGMSAADCARDPVAALALNGVATARLVEAAVAAKVGRFVHLSTAHVYASPLTGVIDETTCPANLHPYATSHRAGEDAVRAAHRAGRIEGVVVRLSNAFGAPAEASANCWMLLVNDLARQGARLGKMVLQSAGAQRRDFVAMSEACRILGALLELPKERLGEGLFNVGGGRSWQVLEMAERLADRAGLLNGQRPTIVRSQETALGQSGELDYKMTRIADAAIALPDAGSIDAEIDALIQFCLAEMR